MDGKRRWLGWIAIGLGALALLVSLSGRSFGAQTLAGPGGATIPQAYAQQGGAPQNGAAPTGPNAQQGSGRASGDRQRGPAAPGAMGWQGGGRPSDSGFGIGGWLGLPFRLFGGIARLALVASVVGLGVWLLRGRKTSGPASNRAAEPAQGPAPAQPSATGEVYTEASDADEPGDQA